MIFRRGIALWIFTAILGPALLFPGRASAQETEKFFLWKVSSKTNTIYVLGSMHAANKDFFPLAVEIEDAYAKSKSLVVEVNIEKLNQAKIQEMVVKNGVFPAGESLSKALSKKTMDALREYGKKRKLPVATFEPLRPWVVNLLVSVTEMQAAGLNPEAGIDMYFLKKAKAEKKPVLELETAEGQLELFAGMSPELQENLLAKSLEGTDEFKKLLDKLTDAWKKGDAKAMEQLALGDTLKKHPEYKGLMEKMFDERNVKMVEKIDEFMKNNESVFVVVGAGHLVGPKGIVKLLEDRQYQVSQVTRTPALKKAS